MVQKEKSRGDEFVDKVPTRIWMEKASESNPFIAADHFCYGYSHRDILKKCSFAESSFLLFRGELPNESELEQFEYLLSIPIAIGPRHHACRAGMNAGVSKTRIQHLLPISLSVLSGMRDGTAGLLACCEFFLSCQSENPKETLANLLDETEANGVELESLLQGFGRFCGSMEEYPRTLVDDLAEVCTGKYFTWAREFADRLRPYNCDWTIIALFAAIALDMGFTKQQTVGLFQMACAPLLLAFAIEKSEQALTSMPFIKDENYVIEK